MRLFNNFAIFSKLLGTWYKMAKPETLEAYYANRPFLKSVDLSREEGHFNVFRIEDYKADDKNNVAYGRKDYFKICLVNGNSKIHYADKSFEILEHGLLFTSTLIPYNWEVLEPIQTGYSCIFTESFFTNYGELKKYPFFSPNGYPVFELNKSEVDKLEKIFIQMIDGIRLRTASDFADQMAVHVNHLNKSIKKVTQKTTSELIADRLLKEAKIMLRHSSWAISEIAYNLGFDGPSHFSNFFKKQLKITPSEYRNF